jgi:hypothetical protein
MTPGYQRSPLGQGPDPLLNSTIDPVTGEFAPFTLTPGSTEEGLNAGLINLTTVTISPVASPRNTHVGTVAVEFSGPVTGVAFHSFFLVRDATFLSLVDAFTQESPSRYLLDLSALTAEDGSYRLSLSGSSSLADAFGNPLVLRAEVSWVVDTGSPTVVVGRAESQPASTGDSPLLFTAVFSEPVTGFTAERVTLGGTAGASTAVVTGEGPTYTIAVSGMTRSGTVTVSLAEGAGADAAGNPSLASTGSDNSVVFTAPTPPDAPTVSSPPAPVVTAATSLTISGTAAANSLVRVYLDADKSGSVTADDELAGSQQLSGGAESYSILVTLRANEALQFLVTASNTAGESAAALVPPILQQADPGLPPGSRFVVQLYRDLLGREPEPDGPASWVRLLDAGGRRADVVQGITRSVEYARRVLDELYRRYLHRAPDPFGLESFTPHLTGGGSAQHVEATIAGSEEYFQLQGGDSQGYLAALYRDGLGRELDPFGRDVFTDALANGVSPHRIATAILSSPELQENLVQGSYRRFLGRDADDFGVAVFTQALGQGARPEDVLAAVLSSDEYFARS